MPGKVRTFLPSAEAVITYSRTPRRRLCPRVRHRRSGIDVNEEKLQGRPFDRRRHRHWWSEWRASLQACFRVACASQKTVRLERHQPKGLDGSNFGSRIEGATYLITHQRAARPFPGSGADDDP